MTETTNQNGKIKGTSLSIMIIMAVLLIIFITALALIDSNKGHFTDNSESIETNENEQVYPNSDLYDIILASGDGYNIVSKHIETYDSSYDEYGIITDGGEWITPMSNSNYIAKAAESVLSDGYNAAFYEPEFYYLEESMFAVCCSCAVLGVTNIPNGYEASYRAHGSCWIINPEKQISFGAGGYLVTKYVDGYVFTKTGNAGNTRRFDKEGNEMTFVQSTNNLYIGRQSCGLIYIDKKFYDIESGEVKIDLSDFNMGVSGYESTTNGGRLSFNSNGECYFEFYNPSGIKYGVTIDTSGNFIEEPHVV